MKVILPDYFFFWIDEYNIHNYYMSSNICALGKCVTNHACRHKIMWFAIWWCTDLRNWYTQKYTLPYFRFIWYLFESLLIVT
jgi:hypothetical protein